MRVISVIFPFLFEIPPQHIIWEIVCAHVTLEMSSILSEHVAKLHISIIHLHGLSPNRLCTYHLKKRVQVCGNNTSMASFKIAVTPLLTHWSYRCLALSRRHVRENVKDYKTGHCHAECNVPALWPPSYFEDFLLFILQFAFLWVNRWHFCNVCWEWLTYHTNLFCNISTDTHELIYITAMSDDRHVVSNHRSIDCLFNI